MAYVPPLRKRPRRTEARMTRGWYIGPHVYLPGARAPEHVTRRQAEILKRTGSVV